jgi:hypothetical protein
VRHEVRAALRANVRVVPVLVDHAGLPTAAELPEDLSPLVRRQAVSVRDESWHRDVDDLINRLEREPTEASPSPPGRSRRTAMIVAALAVVLIAVGITAAVVLDDGNETEQTASDGALPPCETADASWSPATIEGNTVDVQIDAHDIQIEPRSANSRSVGDRYIVQVEFAVANVGTPVAGTSDDDIYINDDYLSGLTVDGVKTDRVECVSAVGDQQLAPGQVVLITWGWESAIDPAGAQLVLALDPEGNVPIGVG